MKTELLWIAFAATALFSLGDILAAAWGKTGHWWWFVSMLVAGNIAWILFALLNRSWPLAVVSGIVNIGLSVASVFAGWLIFGERLQPLEKLAIAIGLLSLTLFTYARITAPQLITEKPSLEQQPMRSSIDD